MLSEHLELREDLVKVGFCSLCGKLRLLRLCSVLSELLLELVIVQTGSSFLDRLLFGLHLKLFFFVIIFKTSELIQQTIVIVVIFSKVKLLHVMLFGFVFSFHLREKINKLIISQDSIFISVSTFEFLFELSIEFRKVFTFDLRNNCLCFQQLLLVNF